MASPASSPSCCLLLLLLLLATTSADHGSSVSTTAPLPAGGGLPLWVQRLLALGSGAPTLGALGGKQFVVAPNGGAGEFRSIGAALQAAVDEDPIGKGRVIIFIKAGLYEESLNVTRKHVILVGEGAGKSVISGNKGVGFDNNLSTHGTATLSVYGRSFMAQDLTIRNTAGPAGKQAVALMSRSHYSLVYRCSIEGYQDTLDAETGPQMYLETSIHGTVDFIFGYARAVFLGCRLLVRHPGTASHNVVTAQGRTNPNDTSAFVFHNCSITADDGANLTGVETFLGRPWKSHSHVVFMESFLDAIVDPRGWVEWNRTAQEQIPDTVLYLEYRNSGPGADTTHRVNTSAVRVASCGEAERYTADLYLNATKWMPAEPDKARIPYYPRSLQHPCQ